MIAKTENWHHQLASVRTETYVRFGPVTEHPEICLIIRSCERPQCQL